MSSVDDKNKAQETRIVLTQPATTRLADAEALALTAISTHFGVPIPPSLAKNVLAATGALVVSLLDVPTAWLQGMAREIRAASDARAHVIEDTADIAIAAVESDEALKRRATQFLGGRMLREQANREAVVAMAMQTVASEAPSTEVPPAAIEEDWLDIFARHAETKSSEDMRAYFARVLAGEIRKPGSFSPATLEVLARLAPSDAAAFQRLCGITCELVGLPPFVLAAPYGNPSGNGLAPLGFPYLELCKLQEAGLVQYDLTSWREMPPMIFALGDFSVGRKRILLGVLGGQPTAKQTRAERFSVVNLTRAGAELLRVAHAVPNEQYVAKLFEWAAGYDLRQVTRAAPEGSAPGA